jgi:antitoxin component YwqK of YwqJK toxin-antitoxin module
MSYEERKSPSGFIYKEWKNKAGSLHREDGPSLICYYPDGCIHQESFYISGVLHRESGPADIVYYPDGSKQEYFIVAGKLHRDSGPSRIDYYPDGSIYHEEFRLAGKYLGKNKIGFWALWERLDEEKRQAPDILKYLARYS